MLMRSSERWLATCALLATLTMAGPAVAATFRVVNLDGAGEGLNSNVPALPIGGNTGNTVGEQRQIALQYAADLWGESLDSDVEIKMDSNFDTLECSAGGTVLGATSPRTIHAGFPGAPLADTYYHQALANKLAGYDLVAATNDLRAEFNSALGEGCLFPRVWYYGLDGLPPAGTIDFVSVALHEIAHGIGFTTYVNLNTGARFNGRDDIFMVFLEDHSLAKRWTQMTDAQRATSTRDGIDLHWVGSETVAAAAELIDGVDPSGHVRMYAPNTIEPGSSVAHFDTSATPNELLEPAYAGANHDLGLARELLADLGWGLPACGNGTVDAGEQCDDGNTAPGDCCDPTCMREAQNSPCDDADACTDGEKCRMGECEDGEPIECDDGLDCTTDTCDGEDGCVYTPGESCEATCGDFNDDGVINATDALGALQAAVGSRDCAVYVCDVNANGTINTTDALTILKRAVNPQQSLACPA